MCRLSSGFSLETPLPHVAQSFSPGVPTPQLLVSLMAWEDPSCGFLMSNLGEEFGLGGAAQKIPHLRIEMWAHSIAAQCFLS